MYKNRIGIVIVCCIAITAIGVMYNPKPANSLIANGRSFSAEYMTTARSRERGLSGRKDLAPSAAAVFIFDDPDTRCFWMKDMKFNLDIVWLDSQKKVNAIEHNVAPSTYPDSFCHVNARYVVEFTAGTAKELGLQVGDTFAF